MDLRYRTAEEALPDVASAVMKYGAIVDSRNGRTCEVLYPHIVLTEPWRRVITNPARKVSLPAQIAETMWLLAGRDDIGWLSHYLPRAPEFSDDGETWRGAYGKRLRHWDEADVDQLAEVVGMLREDPGTRQAVMSIWDPLTDVLVGKDVPCNNWLHFLNRGGKLNLHVAIRSNDLIWGWSGINSFEWSALLEIVAGLVGAEVGELHFSISSLHVYEKHWARAERIAERGPEVQTYKPEARFAPREQSLEQLDIHVRSWFYVERQLREHPQDPTNYRFFADFGEPMMREWLAVIGWWWSGDARYLDMIDGTALKLAALRSPGRPIRSADIDDPFVPEEQPAFTEFVAQLHAEKHAVYGDSWKRRGEQIGILANIARKIDRLGVAGGGDTAADTAIDLLCYLVKYRLWLTETAGATSPVNPERWSGAALTEDAGAVTQLLKELWGVDSHVPPAERAPQLVRAFADLEHNATFFPGSPRTRIAYVDAMLPIAHDLAHYLWSHQ
jgi:thymidylate synthase